MTDRYVEQVFDLVNDFTNSILGLVDVARKLDIDGRNYFVVGNFTPRVPPINNRRFYTFQVEPDKLHTLKVYGDTEGSSLRVDGERVNYDTAKNGYQFTSNASGVVTISFWGDEDLPFIDGRARAKLEKGPQATDWTPAPEDGGDL